MYINGGISFKRIIIRNSRNNHKPVNNYQEPEFRIIIKIIIKVFGNLKYSFYFCEKIIKAF